MSNEIRRAAVTCPSCGDQATLAELGQGRDGGGEALLTAICSTCQAVVNLSLIGRPIAAIEAAVRAESDRDNGLVELYGRSFVLTVEARRRSLEALLRAHAPRGRTRFCDFGCGDALTAVAARDLFDQVHALDLTLINARATLAFARDCGLETFHLGRMIDTLPGDFDLILARQVVQHLADAPATLSRLAALLAQGGVLVIEAPIFDPGRMTPATTFLPGAAGFAATLRRRGFAVVESARDEAAGIETIVVRPPEQGSLR